MSNIFIKWPIVDTETNEELYLEEVNEILVGSRENETYYSTGSQRITQENIENLNGNPDWSGTFHKEWPF